MANCNENIAMVAGVNAGIIAELIKDITKDELELFVTKPVLNFMKFPPWFFFYFILRK